MKLQKHDWRLTVSCFYLNSFVLIYSLFFQASPSGVSDNKLQLLHSVSRVASLDDISKWSVTKIDTLAALMNPDDGPWEAAQVQCQGILKTIKHNNLEKQTLIQYYNPCSYLYSFSHLMWLLRFFKLILFRAKQSSLSICQLLETPWATLS